VVSTASNPGPLVGGCEVDVNDVLAPDCGQWNLMGVDQRAVDGLRAAIEGG